MSDNSRSATPISSPRWLGTMMRQTPTERKRICGVQETARIANFFWLFWFKMGIVDRINFCARGVEARVSVHGSWFALRYCGARVFTVNSELRTMNLLEERSDDERTSKTFTRSACAQDRGRDSFGGARGCSYGNGQVTPDRMEGGESMNLPTRCAWRIFSYADRGNLGARGRNDRD